MEKRESPVVRGRVSAPRPDGVRRSRLVDPLADLDAGRTGLVVAPAGAGKTTLLAHVAASSNLPVAWLTLDERSGSVPAFLAQLEAAIRPVARDLQGGWTSIDEAVSDLERALDAPVLVVLDDVHVVGDHPTGGALAGLIDLAPASMRLLLSSRRPAGTELHRRRLEGTVVELDADALRFRTWEVEELFRDCYGMRLHADELAQLTQRTAGWAAGLQMFHLATQGRSASEHGRVLAGPGLGIRFTREYLASNVLAVVPSDLRRFLIRTAVFDELTPSRCDELLETTGAAEHLDELERRGLFTFVEDDGRAYRYHEVLRTYLLETLAFEAGGEVARSLHRRAGAILEADGAPSGAVTAFSRGGAWDDVARILGQQGEEIADHPGTWIDLLPATIRHTDPWVLLAVARRLVASGSLPRARDIYRQVVEQLGTGADTAATVELRLLESWLSPDSGVRPTQWAQLVRQACAGFDGGAVPDQGSQRPPDLVARGLALLLRGELTVATATFDSVLEDPDSESAGGGRCAPRAGGRPRTGRRRRRHRHRRPRRGGGQPARRGGADPDGRGGPPRDRAQLGTGRPPAGRVRSCRRRMGRSPRPVADRRGAARHRRRRHASSERQRPPSKHSVPRRWPPGPPRSRRSPRSTPAATSRPTTPAPWNGGRAPRARSPSRSRWSPPRWPRPPPPPAPGHGRKRSPSPSAAVRPRSCARPCWSCTRTNRRAISPRHRWRPQPTSHRPEGDVITVTCLGAFSLQHDGVPVQLDGLRPQPQTLLRVLALHANRTVHRERLAEWVWAGRGPDRSGHNLQVAVSAIRRILEDGPAGGRASVVRDGEGYRLALRSDDDSDVRRLERLLASAARHAQSGDLERRRRRTTAARWRSTGASSCPTRDPADWVVEERARLAAAVTGALEWLADDASERGEPREAATWARRGLALDRYRDGLWRRAIAATRAAGDPIARAVARGRLRSVVRRDGRGPELAQTSIFATASSSASVTKTAPSPTVISSGFDPTWWVRPGSAVSGSICTTVPLARFVTQTEPSPTAMPRGRPPSRGESGDRGRARVDVHDELTRGRPHPRVADGDRVGRALDRHLRHDLAGVRVDLHDPALGVVDPHAELVGRHAAEVAADLHLRELLRGPVDTGDAAVGVGDPHRVGSDRDVPRPAADRHPLHHRIGGRIDLHDLALAQDRGPDRIVGGRHALGVAIGRDGGRHLTGGRIDPRDEAASAGGDPQRARTHGHAVGSRRRPGT